MSFVDHTNTPTTSRGVPGKRISGFFFNPQDWVRVRQDTTRSASAALNSGEPIN